MSENNEKDWPLWEVFYQPKNGSVGTGRGIELFGDSTLSTGNSSEISAETMIVMGGNTNSRTITFSNLALNQFDIISYNIMFRMNSEGTTIYRSSNFENISKFIHK